MGNWGIPQHSESDLDLYKVSGAQLGIKTRNCVLCLCSGGGGDEAIGKHFQTDGGVD